MKASVSTYCHCRDDDRPPRPAQWEHIQKRNGEKRAGGQTLACIVNFQRDTVEFQGGWVHGWCDVWGGYHTEYPPVYIA